jgi:hypothetical protein
MAEADFSSRQAPHDDRTRADDTKFTDGYARADEHVGGDPGVFPKVNRGAREGHRPSVEIM